MKPRVLLSLLGLALPATSQAQTLDHATRKGIDAHAFQFSGRHCSGGIEADSSSDNFTPSQFRILALLLDEGLKEGAAENPAFRYKSNFNEKDLYRTTITAEGKSKFMMMFLNGSKLFTYSCDLK